MEDQEIKVTLINISNDRVEKIRKIIASELQRFTDKTEQYLIHVNSCVEAYYPENKIVARTGKYTPENISVETLTRNY